MAADTTTSRVPDARFLVAHPAHFLALGFGSGLIRWAPGTWGTLVSLGLYHLLALALPPVVIAFLAIPLFFAGVWICDVTSRNLGVQDHGAIVWDEIVAFLLVLFFTPRTLPWQCVAFVLFRFFDAVKPGPIRYIESRFRGGFGVMVDDLAAAFFTLLSLTVIMLLLRALGGSIGFAALSAG